VKPLKIFIADPANSPLSLAEIKYAFKTLLTIGGFPWHFIKTPQDADIYYGPPSNRAKTLYIEMASITLSRDQIIDPKKVLIENSIYFIDFTNTKKAKPILIQHDNAFEICNDIILSTFYFISGWQETSLKRDKRDFVNIKDVLSYKEKFLHIPVVSQYALLLQQHFLKSHEYVPLWPSGKEFAVALSHDIDYPEIVPSIEVIRYLIKQKHHSSPKVVYDILTGKEHFWKFEEWMRLEQQFGVKSAFYFCGLKSTLLDYFTKVPNPFYDVSNDNFKSILKLIHQNEFEVGLHASWFAYQNANQFLYEKQRIENVLENTIYGNRHHYWHMNPYKPYETAQIHHKIGLVYDSSLAFEHRSGFRNAISHPFHLIDKASGEEIQTLQIPPVLMDDHLLGHFELSYFDSPEHEINNLLNTAIKYQGVFCADYHERGLNQTLCKTWNNHYRFMLMKISENSSRAYCDTPYGIAKHWIRREKLLKEFSIE
jgi:hypothetical protein